jgi:DNA-binding NarL/FixJ family response regulator
MPGGGTPRHRRRVKEQAPETAVLVITSFDGDEELFGVLDAGANGYLMKDTRPDRVVQAIRSVFDGQAVFDAAIASRVISGRTNGVDANAMLSDPLSEREREVLGLMSRGLGNKDIGKELWISETTVKTHVSHILRKLGQNDRTQAVLTALRMGIVALEDAV